MLLFVSVKKDLPAGAECRTALSDAICEALVHLVRDQKGPILRPAIEVLGLADFLGAQRVAMRSSGVLLGRRSVTDHAVHDDQCRLALVGAEALQRACDAHRVV